MIYFNTFFFFSILGYFMEMMIGFFLHQQKETLLIGPWMPIYGLGFLLIHFIDKLLERKCFQKKKRIILSFIIDVLLLSLLEYIGGVLTLHLFGKTFWNYKGIPGSFGPFVNVYISLLWGAGAIFLEYVIYPRLQKFLKKLPKWIALVVFILFFLDNMACWLKHFGL